MWGGRIAINTKQAQVNRTPVVTAMRLFWNLVK